jgi:acyl carrier protein
MKPEETRAVVLRTLARIAPEADLEQLRPDVSLREQLDIDSMDFLNFVIALHKELGVDIPEKDYPKFATVDGCVEYLTPAAATRAQG